MKKNKIYKFVKKHKFAFLSFSICLFIGFLSFAYFIYKGNGAFTLRGDFNSQQLTFNMYANDVLKSGFSQWSWNTDLGTQFVGAFSFYNLGSPFFWVSLVFPSSAFPFIVGILYMLKYAVAGLLSYLFLKRFVSKKEYAVLGSILYAFCGFQSTNLMFNHFHDVVALFPLLLIGIEKLITEKRKGFFVVAVFFNCLLNYFFFIGEVLFLIIYFICRFHSDIKTMLKNIGICMIEGLLGIGLAAFLFVPSIMFILNNPRAGFSTEGIFALTFSKTEYLAMLKSLLMPGEVMFRQSAITSIDWSSTSLYLPCVACSLVIAYVMKKRNWITAMIIILAVCSAVPLLTASFYGFTAIYHRWWYMFIIIMVLASIKVIENRREYPIKTSILISLGVLILLTMYIYPDLILRKNVFLLYLMMSMMGLIILFILDYMKNDKKFIKMLLVFVSLFSFASTAFNIFLYRQGSSTSEEILKKINDSYNLKTYDMQYRYAMYDNYTSFIGKQKNIWSFDSTISPTILEFNQAFGFERTSTSMRYEEVPYLEALLSGKYKITDDAKQENIIDKYSSNEGTNYVVEQEALPIGFSQNAYILKSEFMNIKVEDRAKVAIAALVIDDDNKNTIKGLSKYTYDNSVNNVSFMGDKENLENFEITNDGFRGTISLSDVKSLFFSIPYDNGWSAYVDGKEVEIFKSIGMMALKLNEGNHNIKFTYSTPGMFTGIVVSLASCLLFAFYIILNKKLHNKHINC
ncbi:YfhO family protein [Amedibacillus sp. YH-ame6]